MNDTILHKISPRVHGRDIDSVDPHTKGRTEKKKILSAHLRRDRLSVGD